MTDHGKVKGCTDFMHYLCLSFLDLIDHMSQHCKICCLELLLHFLYFNVCHIWTCTKSYESLPCIFHASHHCKICMTSISYSRDLNDHMTDHGKAESYESLPCSVHSSHRYNICKTCIQKLKTLEFIWMNTERL